MLELVRSHEQVRYMPSAQAADELDEAHGAVWAAIRHLFPRHAMVNQTDHGCMLVSWKLRDPTRTGTHFAAPVIIRIEPGLLLALWTSDEESRREIAELQVETVSEALAGYEPRSRVPSCDVILLGE